MFRGLLAVIGSLFSLYALAAEPAFTVKPSVTRTQAGVVIGFTAASPCDVEVAVLDRAGKVVRHLAAGQLGDRAPTPLQSGSLKQSLTWDGKDDLGQVAKDAPFTVRVGLGLRPEFAGLLGDNPGALDSVRGLATGPGGELFVFHTFGELHPGDGTSTCAVFDRQGKYLRTIVPFPAHLGEDKLKGLKRLALENGDKIPFLYQAETRSLLPGIGDLPSQRPVVTRDGRLALIGVQEGPHRYAQAGRNQLLVLNTDGSLPADGALKTVLADSSRSGANLALSPDEKLFYASGLSIGDKPSHAIYCFGWNDARPRVFAGSATESGDDAKHFSSPQGIAVDKAGNVYIADRGNNRIVVLKPDGTFLGSLSVERPETLEVHPKTGVIYAICGPGINQLVKFNSWKDDKPVAELKLPTFKHPYFTAVMALDASAEPPVLWVGTPKSYYAKYDLLRIEDAGASFAKPVDIGKLAKESKPTIGPVIGMDLDRQRGRLFVNTKIYDTAANKWGVGFNESSGKSLDGKGVGSVGLDGNFYSQIFPQIVRRMGPDLKKIPFTADTASEKGDLLNPIKGTMRIRGRGITADPQGNIFVLWEDTLTATRGQAFNHIYVYNPDGSLKKEKLLDSGIRSVNSVRLDYAGNIYVALGLRPGTELLPDGLRGQLPAGAKDADAVNGVNLYPLLYGSIAKFSPTGGAIRPGIGGVPANYAWGTPIEVKGAEWIFSGASPVVSWRVPGTPDICNCESPRFDVDPYGRSFFTDAARFRVGMLDTNGNLLGWFGSYGNVDSAGPESKIPTPAIPLYWPYHVSVDDGHAYVGDRLNRRVVRVKLNYAASASAVVPE